MFGRLSDKLGHRNLFMWPLAIYLVGTAYLPQTRDPGRNDDDHASFLYNAIFFTYALVLTKFYRLRTQDALGNWVGSRGAG